MSDKPVERYRREEIFKYLRKDEEDLEITNEEDTIEKPHIIKKITPKIKSMTSGLEERDAFSVEFTGDIEEEENIEENLEELSEEAFEDELPLSAPEVTADGVILETPVSEELKEATTISQAIDENMGEMAIDTRDFVEELAEEPSNSLEEIPTQMEEASVDETFERILSVEDEDEPLDLTWTDTNSIDPDSFADNEEFSSTDKKSAWTPFVPALDNSTTDSEVELHSEDELDIPDDEFVTEDAAVIHSSFERPMFTDDPVPSTDDSIEEPFPDDEDILHDIVDTEEYEEDGGNYEYSEEADAIALATRYLEEYEHNPTSASGAEALFLAAENFKVAGLPGKAKGLYENFIKIFPSHPRVTDAQQALHWMEVDAPSEDQVVGGGAKTRLDMLRENNSTTPEVEHDQSKTTHMHVIPTNDTKTTKSKDEIEKELDADFEGPVSSWPIVRFFQSRSVGELLGFVAIVILLGAILFFLISNKNNRTSNRLATLPNSSEQVTSGNNNSSSSSTTNTDTEKDDENSDQSKTDQNKSAESSVENTDEAVPLSKGYLIVSGGSDFVLDEGGYGLQVKYTLRKSEADSIANSWRMKSYRSGVVAGPDNGYRVIVGQFPSKSIARNNLRNLPNAPEGTYTVDINEFAPKNN